MCDLIDMYSTFPRHKRENAVCTPGLVGNIGDGNTVPRLKKSCPENDLRFDDFVNEQTRNGTHMTDGGVGKHARVEFLNSTYDPFKLNNLIIQDIGNLNRQSEPIVLDM